MPTKIAIRAALEKVLREVQGSSGRVCPDVTDGTKPIGDLDAFDSLMADEATVLLEQELKVKLAEGTPFVSSIGRKRALTITEIVDRICAMIVATRAA
jgi:acyl carrier protein